MYSELILFGAMRNYLYGGISAFREAHSLRSLLLASNYLSCSTSDMTERAVPVLGQVSAVRAL